MIRYWKPDRVRTILLARTALVAILAMCITAISTPPVFAQTTGQEVIEQARKECASLDDGTLDVSQGAITSIDVTGDGVADEVVDMSKVICSSARSFFCGTGGCGLTIIANGKSSDFLAKAWKVVMWDEQPILLLIVHGSECGYNNLRRCYRAAVWTETGFSTVGNQ